MQAAALHLKIIICFSDLERCGLIDHEIIFLALVLHDLELILGLDVKTDSVLRHFKLVYRLFLLGTYQGDGALLHLKYFLLIGNAIDRLAYVGIENVLKDLSLMIVDAGYSLCRRGLFALNDLSHRRMGIDTE